MLHIFNEINSRCINNEANIFGNFKNAVPFFVIIIGSVIVQILIVEFTGIVFNVVPLSFKYYIYSVLIGMSELILYQIIRFIPYKCCDHSEDESAKHYTYITPSPTLTPAPFSETCTPDIHIGTDIQKQIELEMAQYKAETPAESTVIVSTISRISNTPTNVEIHIPGIRSWSSTAEH